MQENDKYERKREKKKKRLMEEERGPMRYRVYL